MTADTDAKDRIVLQLLEADPSKAYTEQQIADELGISRQMVQLIEKAALRKLRKRMNRADWLW